MLMRTHRVWCIWHRDRQQVRRSLQARTVAVSMLVVLLTAALLSLFSMYVIRGSVLKQATDDSRSDFSSQIVRVQKHLNASNLTGTDQYQQLVSNLASELQSNGSSNLVGVMQRILRSVDSCRYRRSRNIQIWCRHLCATACVPIRPD